MKTTRVANLSGSFRWRFFDPSKFNFHEFVRDDLEVYDCDDGGVRTTFWVVVGKEPTFYKVVHSYGWDNYGEDDAAVYNEFDVTEVERGEIGSYAVENLKFVV